MAVFDAAKEKYELAEIDGIPVLFTNRRLNRDTIPEGLFCYEAWDSDRLDAPMVQIRKSVLVNYGGTILSKKPFPLDNHDSYSPQNRDYHGISMDLEEFQQSTEEQLQMKVDGEAGMQMGAM
ncbi:MAG: hypothetical protein LUE24_10150 [Lachnospiraceae bacterium]|nr:hypothetical protein [Lachnospiraceae bacterium]